ncbi:hypothetical protein AHAT_38490 [Agarivorans sp. Toyoura001]|nr:hypothetical protein AHAT_38490 [Agarivorans sp. Toyoura001]
MRVDSGDHINAPLKGKNTQAKIIELREDSLCIFVPASEASIYSGLLEGLVPTSASWVCAP